ncbi:hypothetical protein [Methanimicrococcus blatticola]|uniref:Uncharacterized protein n=1 Tax=Methanimicrococcus blatticola TaxID=91560 RepID=A0A484F473_9EURY|nr:hypothetical protein [Methanimicrococcus blatticola]MBZ3935623.1 hypothetical protein [Methanimicrococcus blatticola]MCC2509264.1 hypothetical protein [Methanimicrococcus blatticola]TDQ69371.1 hypothetical protein C7391_0696 [Methanimicrococcus blatticola]
MKASHFFILFAAVSVILVASTMFQYSLSSQPPIHINQMDIHFTNENATVRIDYEVGFLSQLYVFFFGSRNLDPYLDVLLYDFEEYRITSVHGTTATIELINSSRREGLYYLHDSHRLGYEVGHLALYFPDGKTMTFDNATETPNVFY